jgi:hypothetical protein
MHEDGGPQVWRGARAGTSNPSRQKRFRRRRCGWAKPPSEDGWFGIRGVVRDILGIRPMDRSVVVLDVDTIGVVD